MTNVNEKWEYKDEKLYLVNNCRYFEIVVDALLECLPKIGIQCESVPVPEDDDRLYVIFTTHVTEEGSPFYLDLPRRFVSYNFEQLTTCRQWPESLWKDRFSKAVEVWEYSRQNFEAHEKHGIDMGAVRHVPLGWAESMTCVERFPWDAKSKPTTTTESNGPPPSAVQGIPDVLAPSHGDSGLEIELPKDVDYLFLGATNQHRLLKMVPVLFVYSQLPNKCCIITNDCWGKKNLGRLYESCHLGVNLHFYEGDTILEVHRILPFIGNGVWVLSERSADPFYDELLDGLVTWIQADSREILVKGMDILDMKPVDRDEELRRRREELVKRVDYVTMLRTALLGKEEEDAEDIIVLDLTSKAQLVESI